MVEIRRVVSDDEANGQSDATFYMHFV